jgi:hypothetical protein
MENTMSTKLFYFSAIMGVITLISVMDASAREVKSSKGPAPTTDEQFMNSIIAEGDHNDPIQRRYRKLDDKAGIQFLNISITRCGHLSDAEYKACQSAVLDGLEAGKTPATIIPDLERKIESHTLLQPAKKEKTQRGIASHVKPKSKKVLSKKAIKGKKISRHNSKSKRTIAYNR